MRLAVIRWIARSCQIQIQKTEKLDLYEDSTSFYVDTILLMTIRYLELRFRVVLTCKTENFAKIACRLDD